MTPPMDIDRLDRYLAGESSPQEMAEVDRWIAEHPDRARIVTRLRTDVARAPLERAPDTAKWTAWLEHRIDGAAPAVTNKYPKVPLVDAPGFPVHRFQARRLIASAASAGLGVALIGVLAYNMMVHSRSRATSVAQQYRTVAGQRASITLANGSRAVLGPATTLDVVPSSSNGATTVKIVGEALFTVAQNARAPFIVQSGGSITRVLGTTFLVRRYATDAATRVVVAAGKVAVSSAHVSRTTPAATVLTPGMLAMVNDSGLVRIAPNIAIDDYTAFATGRLVFRKTPVDEVLADLGRAYNVNFRVSDSTLNTHRLTWTIHTETQSLADVLEEFPLVLNVRVLRAGGVITLVPRAPLRRAEPMHLISREERYGL